MYKRITFGIMALGLVAGSLIAPGPANADPQWQAKYYSKQRPNQYYPDYPARGRFNGNNRVDGMQNNTNAMIMRGVASGRLTQREADKLMSRQQQIDNMQARYNADGRLNSGERNKLNNEVAKLQSQLWKDMNNYNIR